MRVIVSVSGVLMVFILSSGLASAQTGRPGKGGPVFGNGEGPVLVESSSQGQESSSIKAGFGGSAGVGEAQNVAKEHGLIGVANAFNRGKAGLSPGLGIALEILSSSSTSTTSTTATTGTTSTSGTN